MHGGVAGKPVMAYAIRQITLFARFVSKSECLWAPHQIDIDPEHHIFILQMPRFRNPWQLEQQKNVASPSLGVTTPGFFRRIWRSVRMNPSRLLAIGIVSS